MSAQHARVRGRGRVSSDAVAGENGTGTLIATRNSDVNRICHDIEDMNKWAIAKFPVGTDATDNMVRETLHEALVLLNRAYNDYDCRFDAGGCLYCGQHATESREQPLDAAIGDRVCAAAPSAAMLEMALRTVLWLCGLPSVTSNALLPRSYRSNLYEVLGGVGHFFVEVMERLTGDVRLEFTTWMAPFFAPGRSYHSISQFISSIDSTSPTMLFLLSGVFSRDGADVQRTKHIQCGRLALAREAIRAGVDINTRVSFFAQSYTALTWALSMRDYVLAAFLLSAGAHGEGALRQLLRHNPEPWVLSQFMWRYGLCSTVLDVYPENGSTPLMNAVTWHNDHVLDIVKLVLSAIYHQVGGDGMDMRAHINVKDGAGVTAIMWLLMVGQRRCMHEVLLCLLRHGADTNATVGMAWHDNHQHGMAVPTGVYGGSTPLMMLLHNTRIRNRAMFVHTLLNWGADPCAFDVVGRSALSHLCSFMRQFTPTQKRSAYFKRMVARLLHLAKETLNIRDVDGDTPLSLLMTYGFETSDLGVWRMLRSSGAMTPYDNDGSALVGNSNVSLSLLTRVLQFESPMLLRELFGVFDKARPVACAECDSPRYIYLAGMLRHANVCRIGRYGLSWAMRDASCVLLLLRSLFHSDRARVANRNDATNGDDAVTVARVGTMTPFVWVVTCAPWRFMCAVILKMRDMTGTYGLDINTFAECVRLMGMSISDE